MSREISYGREKVIGNNNCREKISQYIKISWENIVWSSLNISILRFNRFRRACFPTVYYIQKGPDKYSNGRSIHVIYWNYLRFDCCHNEGLPQLGSRSGPKHYGLFLFQSDVELDTLHLYDLHELRGSWSAAVSGWAAAGIGRAALLTAPSSLSYLLA